MKHIFIVNPAAGQESIVDRIQREAKKLHEDIEIYMTKCAGDATNYIKAYCTKHTDPVRFYACGGDGTLHEVVNGVVGFDFAAIGCVPGGSGNDFVKYYGGSEAFKDISAIIHGTEAPIDLLKVGEYYAINAVHFGFDSCVAEMISILRRTPIIGKKYAYPTAVFLGLFKGMYHRCKVEVDGRLINPKGSLLLCTLCNAQFVGGSYRTAPRSRVDDGLIDVCLVSPMTHPRFIQIMGYYQKGLHFNEPRFKKFFTFERGQQIHVKSKKNIVFSMDGELMRDSDFTVELVPHATRFVVPQGAKAIDTIEAPETQS